MKKTSLLDAISVCTQNMRAAHSIGCRYLVEFITLLFYLINRQEPELQAEL